MSNWIADCGEGLGVGVGVGGQMPLGTAGPTGQEPQGLLGFAPGSSAVTADFENTGTANGGTVVTGAPAADQEGARPSSESDNTVGLSWGTRDGDRTPGNNGQIVVPSGEDDNTYGLTWGTRKGNR